MMSVDSHVHSVHESAPFVLTSANSLPTNSPSNNEDVLNMQTDEVNFNTPELCLDFDLDPNIAQGESISSSYLSQSKFISNINSGCKNDLLLLHYNVRSLNKNFDQLVFFLDQLKTESSVIGISETWLKDTPSFFSIDGFSFVTNSRTEKRGGGVGLYISSGLSYAVKEEFNVISNSIESIFVEIEFAEKKNVIIGEVYKPPNSNPKDFIDTFQMMLSSPSLNNKTCIVMGDFNLNLLQCDANPNCLDFLNLMLSKSFVPAITKPTRITDTTASLIDNIFVSGTPIAESGIIVNDISDHFPVFTMLPNITRDHYKEKDRFIGKRDFSETNVNRLREALESTDWSDIYNSGDVNYSFDKFMEVLLYYYNRIIPIRQHSRANHKKCPRLPWITKSLLKCINKKNNLYCKYKSKPTVQTKSNYSRYRNTLTTSLRLAKKNYFTRQFNLHKDDIKSTWRVINNVLKTKNKSTPVTKIIVNETVTVDPLAIAEEFNNYFVNIGPNLAQNIPESDLDYRHFLKMQNSRSLFFNPILEHEVIDIVNNLKINKSAGFDGITNHILKEIIGVIVSPLTHILNLSLTEGTVPLKMKIAKVVPIFKKGNTHNLGNYRPISLLTSLSKILEKLIYSRTMKFLLDCNILTDNQFGFRQKHSTTHALLMFLDKVAHAIDNMSHTVGIFLDFSKAFDTINHNILLNKLSHYGIRGKALEWFRNYLTDRKQFVCVNGQESYQRSISCGIPQGSLLGPLLFIIYINDFQNSSQILSFILFADDSNIFFSHRNPQILLHTLNEELKLVQAWINSNKLSLNVEKTHYMLFSNSTKALPGNILIDNTSISQVDSTKFLGIYIDSDLSWKVHTNYLCKLLSRNTGILNKLKHEFPSKILLSLYSTLILPYLNYGVLAWGNGTKTQLDRILLIQKRAIRNINNTGFLSHTSQLFFNNKLLRIPDIYLYNLGIFMYQLSINELPTVISSLFTINNAIHPYPTRQSNFFHLPRIRTNFAKKTFTFSGPKYWNDLPLEITESTSLFLFKRKLKLFLLNGYASQADVGM